MACAGWWLRRSGTSSAQARKMRAGSEPWSLRRPRDGDRNGTRSAPCADHGRVDRHRDRRGQSGPCLARPARRRPPVRGPVRRPATRGGAGGHDRVALRRRGAARDRGGGAPRRAAETAARRGTKKRAKTDRADARHLRELVMIGRLPESWIPPDHLLDLRAKVRLRHTLVAERGEWQQRIQAVLYHHGFPQRLGLLTGENRHWLEELEVSATTREQVTVALGVIDALGTQSAPITRDPRLYALRPPGCP